MANPDGPGVKNLRLRLLGLLPVAAAFTLLAFPASASADPPPGTIVVGTTADTSGTCSLRDAIASANSHTAQGGCATPPASGTTTIEVPGGTYNLTAGELSITSDVNILGGGARSTVIVDFSSGERVLDVASGTAAIEGVTIQGGNIGLSGGDPHLGLGGGIYVTFGASLALNDAMVTGNTAATSGGGIANDGTLTIDHSTVENNTTGNGGTGGGIINFLSLSVTNSTIMNNAAQADGGGLYLVGSTTLTNDTIANNGANAGLAGGNGGGIFVNGVPTATFQLTNTLLAGNTRNGAAQDCSGGGLTSLGGNLSDDASCGFSGAGDLQNASPNLGAVDSNAPTDVLPLQTGSQAIDAGNAFGCPVTDQRLVTRAQASPCDIGAYEFTPAAPTNYLVSTADQLDGVLTYANSQPAAATIDIAAGHYDLGILTGTETDAGGIDLAGAGAKNTVLDGDGMVGDVIDVGGGGSATLIKDVTVENATDTGINDGGLLELDDSIVQNNTDVGIQNNNQGLTVSGSTISGNGNAAAGVDSQFNGGIFSEAPIAVTNSTITGNNGSGIYVDSGGSAQLTDVTIADNPGVGLDLRTPSTAVSTIIGSNPAGDCTNVADNWTSEHNNLDSDTSCNFVDSTDWPEVDPQLGPLQDDGGPTPTMALSAGSEAVDHGDNGNCLPVDQRGITRPQGPQCDIGAYELVEAPAAPQAIAFESNRTGNSEIWTMNPDGSNPAQLTHDGVTDSLPSISPDGHTVVYQHTAAGITQIWAINGDGTNPRALTTQGSNFQPTFSPDGTKIAFDSDRNGRQQLFVMNADGSGQTQVTNMGGTVGVGGSSWSPTGSRIAISDDESGNNEIYTVDAGTGTPSAALTSSGQNRNPQWSPDGSEILFVSDRCTSQAPFCGGGDSVFLMNADGSNQQNLTQAPIFDADPAWSPDGAKIAFVRDLGGQNFNVFTANADGTNQVQLTFGSAPSRNSFPDWGTQPSAAGQLAGSFTQAVVKPVDLTAAGTSDWALWSYNSSAVPASLTPNETKASGGRKISDLTVVNGNGTPTRGFGGFADNLVPFNFDWTDGSPDAAVSGGHGGLTAPAVGQGLSFTVPAGKGLQRLTIWTSAHYANGTLTAHLSDGSAPDYSQTIDAEPGQFGGVSENVPTIFTLEYEASGPGQTLTVTWTDDTNNGCPGCDDIVLYAAALDSGLSNLTVNATPSSAGAGIDQVPINIIPNAWISFFAGSTNSAPVGSTPVGSTPVGSTPVGSTPVGSTPVGSTPVGSTPVGSTPVGSTPVGSTGLFDLPVGSTPVGSTALSSVLLSQVQLHGVAWDQILCGSLLNKPLTAITLQDVKQSAEQCSDGRTSLQHLEALPLSQVDLGTTLLRSVHWATLLMGNTPLSALPGGFEAWCGTQGNIPADGGSCSNATENTTVLQLDVAGQLGSAPVGSTPVGSTPVGSTPVGSTPVGSTDIRASRLATIPLSDINRLDGDLATVVDCTKVSCSTGTLGDAATANAIFPTATFSDIKNAMAANNITINDLVVAIIGAAGFPWETLPIQGLQPYSATKSKVTYTIGNDVDCSLVSQFVLTAHLPAGFFPVDGSAQFSIGNNPAQPAGAPDVVGIDAAEAAKQNAYKWTIGCPAGDNAIESVSLSFDAWVGLNLGTFKANVDVATAVAKISATGAPVTVHQNPEASDPTTASEIKPDTLVAGHIAFSGEQAFYKVKLTDSQGNPLPTGTRISASLNVPDNADLDLTMSAPAAPSFFTTPVGSTPVGSTPIEDSAIGFQGSGVALPPDTLGDVPVGSTPVGSTPVGSTPVGSTSANRDSGVNENAGIITAGQGGYVTIGVSGYNGAASQKPFVLRVQETPPPPLPHCSARTFPNGAPSSFAAGALPSSLPTTTKTLFIVNKQRLTAMYGSTAVTPLLNSLGTLAARSEVAGSVLFVDGNAGVRSAYSAWDSTPCDTTARNNVVRSINDVVATYRNSSAGLPNLHYIVLVGSDEAGPPMADAPDPVLLSPEENEANDLAFTTNGLTNGNATYASAAQNNILTDGAYGAFTNIPWLGRSLLLPQISISRLVETPADMVGQITRYLQSSGYTGTPQSGVGTLNPTSALVTGYDFLADGAQSVESNLKSNFPGALSVSDNLPSGAPAINVPGSAWKAGTAYRIGDIVHPTIPNGLTFQAQNAGTSGRSEPLWPLTVVGVVPSDNGIIWQAIAPWTASDVLSAALASTSVPPSILAINAHYNQYELEAANGDLANSGQASAALAARILFTMGCHGGLNIPDTLSGGTAPGGKYLDWPQLYARDQVATYIANTGYGYGDTASVALSERLMSLFAKNLRSDSGSVGEEWVNALQQYFATAGAYDVYDEKVMEETTFYGLPFWHFSGAPSGSSFTPLTTSADPVTGTQSATITFPGAGATMGTQFGLYRPNLPITSQQVTSSLPARGVWIKNLTSNDTLNTAATLGYPTIDLSAHEPAPNVSPIFFPASPFTLEHSLVFGSERDYLNVSDQFRPTGVGDAGTQRHFGSGTFEIFYSQSADQVAPLISEVNVSDTGGVATVTARVNDDSGHVAEVAALVNDGSWHYLRLTQSSLDPTLWTGTISVSEDPEVFVEATDGSNVSYSANKGQNFTSTNSNSPPSGVQILLQAPVGPYGQGQTVIATYQCGPAAAQCIGTVPNGSPIDTSTFGVHTFVVQAFDADGILIGSLERTYVVQYPFNGFFAPVDNEPVLNVVKAGSGVPVVFSLGGNQGLDIFASGYPKSQTIACDASAPADGIESTVSAGGSSLSYNASTGRYTYVWKTDKSWIGTCRALIVKTKDGVTHRADFKFN
jgi:Tol biopolymer transport system component